MKDDALRLVLERALHAAKKRQTETGFIAENEKISLCDNFLFCLLLLRSKTQEHVLEAKRLLERLLYFQQHFQEVASFGNFPLFLSDFPHCSDHLQALRVLHVELFILKEFSAILGQELKVRLEHSTKTALKFLLDIEREVKLPYWAKYKLACMAAVMNVPFEVQEQQDIRTFGDPQNLAELIVAYQLYPKSAAFWSYLSKVWHEPSKQYVGPAYKVGYQHPNLLVAMALFRREVEKLACYPLFTALLTEEHALIEPSYPELYNGVFDRFSFSVVQKSGYAYSTLLGQPRPEETPGFFPFYLVTGNNSLAIQVPFGYSSSELVFELTPEVFNEEREKAKALVLSFNDQSGNKVLVNGQKATCFTMNDTLELTIGSLKLPLAFTKLAGDGEFVGHIVRGNRSGHNQPRFTATDIQIFLRALRGTTPTTIKVSLLTGE